MKVDIVRIFVRPPNSAKINCTPETRDVDNLMAEYTQPVYTVKPKPVDEFTPPLEKRQIPCRMVFWEGVDTKYKKESGKIILHVDIDATSEDMECGVLAIPKVSGEPIYEMYIVR